VSLPDPRAPVIVGAGQIVQRPGNDSEPLDPIGLAVEALRRAGQDSGTGDRLLRRADSVRHVATTCWAYTNEATLVAEALGAAPRQTVRTALFGGDGPQRLITDTARAIAAGEVDVALISGAEAVASVLAHQRAGGRPQWPEQHDAAPPSQCVGTDRLPSNEAEMAVGLMAPIFNYALLETAVRGRSGATPQAHMQSICTLWARFSRVAEDNPYAWLPRARTAGELADATPSNRPVAAPYLKLLTANIQVDMASALIVCSAQAAHDAGVPADRWVYIWAGSHAHDEWFMSERDRLAQSPALRAAGQAALEHAGLAIDEIAHVDLYSCFPSAVQIGAAELGLSLDDPGRPLTVTGGLTFAGGPGNNYTGHAVATMVSRLRGEPDSAGLVTALGWYTTKHAVGVYGARPPRRPFRAIDAEARLRRPPSRRATNEYAGPAALEAYTVPFATGGTAEAAIVSALAPDGTRALTRTADPDVIETLLTGDPLGTAVELGGAGRIALGSAAR
jgi:acetyl-CoA C-acetyltransferase